MTTRKLTTTTPQKAPRDKATNARSRAADGKLFRESKPKRKMPVSGNSAKPYEVGRGKAAKATRFQKGKSGNPNGRPKKKYPDFDPGNILQGVDNEERIVLVEGKRKFLKNAEIHFRDLFSKAISGNFEAASLIMKSAPHHFGQEAEGPSEVRFVVMPDSFFDRSADPTDAPREQSENSSKDNVAKTGRSRRPRKSRKSDQQSVSVGSLFRKVAKDRVPIRINGDRITIWEAYVRQVYAMANKNNRAARLLQQLRKAFPGDAPAGNPTTYLITEADANL